MLRTHMLAAILRKEVIEALREKHLRMVLIIGLLLPLFFGAIHARAETEAKSGKRTLAGHAPTPASLSAGFGHREPPAFVGPFALAMSVGYGMLLAGIFAITLSLESFVGEKERKTVETLLSTPATDRELFLAKMLACLLVSMAMGVLFGAVGSGGLVVIAKLRGLLMSWALFARIWAYSLALLLGASLTCASLGVILSSRVSTVKAGGQIFGVLMLGIVVAFMVAGMLLEPHQEALKAAAGMLTNMSPWALVSLMLLVAVLLNWALLSLAARTFNRGKILTGL